jgi:hypothetical protein
MAWRLPSEALRLLGNKTRRTDFLFLFLAPGSLLRARFFEVDRKMKMIPPVDTLSVSPLDQ